MSAGPATNITELLLDFQNGNASAMDRLMPLVLGELKRIAARYMRNELHRSVLQTTALVNEAYLRLTHGKAAFENRIHFFGIAASAMRQILVDYARTRMRQKRGGGAAKLDLNDADIAINDCSADMIALDEALGRLAEFDARKSRVVELRFFGGLEVAEVASLLKVSENTVIRDWSIARAWLRNELSSRQP